MSILTVLKRIFNLGVRQIPQTVSWEGRLSFEHARVDRFLFKNVLQTPQEIAHTRSFFVDCLSLSYDEGIPLRREIDLLQGYVQIFRSIEERLHFNMTVELEKDNYIVEPLILFPLVQNAIQATCFMSDTRPIKCKIRLINQVLQMEVSNRVNPYIQSQAETECLHFYRSRLELAYKGRYDLFINSNSNLFKATLRLELPPY